MGGTGLGYWSFFAVLAIAAFVVGSMLVPFLSILAFGAVLAFIFSPVYRLVRAGIRSPSLSAFVVTLLMLVVVLVPLSFAGYQAIREGATVYGLLRSGTVPAVFVSVASYGQRVLNQFSVGAKLDPASLVTAAQSALAWIVARTGQIFLSVSELVLSFVLLLFIFFYFVRDGHAILEGFIGLSPLSAREGRSVLQRIGTSVWAAVIGSVLMALVQGLTAWLGFWILRVPDAALLGGFTMLASFIPSFGTALIQIPVIIYLYTTGAHGAALALTIWSVVVVGLLDNFLRALLLSGTRMHPLLALVSVLGGITFFGPLGIVLGPATVAVFTALLEVSPVVISRAYGKKPTRTSSPGPTGAAR
ncbi:MAG TPA: AI-2E family transporter [Candidatus Paceibacterota bacterium]|nr:AI-2E family transporter [Candidatus Paceibacterota bacterium]